MESPLEAQIEHDLKRRQKFFHFAYMAAYLVLFLYGPKIVDVLLPQDEFFIDKSDRFSLSNASLIASISFFYLGNFLFYCYPNYKKPLFLLLHPVIALAIYMVCLILLQPLIIFPNSLEVGKRYHLVFIGGNGRKVIDDHLYRIPHHDQRRSEQVRAMLFGGMPHNQNNERAEDFFPYTLRLENRMSERYKDYTLRFYLETLKVSVELEQSAKPNPPEFAFHVPTFFKNKELEERTYIEAKPSGENIIDVAFGELKELTILLTREVDGNPVKYVHSDYVEIEMEIMALESE